MPPMNEPALKPALDPGWHGAGVDSVVAVPAVVSGGITLVVVSTVTDDDDDVGGEDEAPVTVWAVVVLNTGVDVAVELVASKHRHK